MHIQDVCSEIRWLRFFLMLTVRAFVTMTWKRPLSIWSTLQTRARCSILLIAIWMISSYHMFWSMHISTGVSVRWLPISARVIWPQTLRQRQMRGRISCILSIAGHIRRMRKGSGGNFLRRDLLRISSALANATQLSKAGSYLTMSIHSLKCRAEGIQFLPV